MQSDADELGANLDRLVALKRQVGQLPGPQGHRAGQWGLHLAAAVGKSSGKAFSPPGEAQTGHSSGL